MPNYKLKLANMRKEQQFTLYPYSGGDDIYLQSDKRMMLANLRTGVAIINATNRNFSGFIHLTMEPLPCQLPEDTLKAIQSYLWHNEGQDGNIRGVVSYENKELFSKP